MSLSCPFSLPYLQQAESENSGICKIWIYILNFTFGKACVWTRKHAYLI